MSLTAADRLVTSQIVRNRASARRPFAITVAVLGFVSVNQVVSYSRSSRFRYPNYYAYRLVNILFDNNRLMIKYCMNITINIKLFFLPFANCPTKDHDIQLCRIFMFHSSSFTLSDCVSTSTPLSRRRLSSREAACFGNRACYSSFPRYVRSSLIPSTCKSLFTYISVSVFVPLFIQ